MKNSEFKISSLDHTWIIDIDGTILKHNGHISNNEEILPGVIEFWKKIPPGDIIILLSARSNEHRESTLAFLISCGIRFDLAVFDLPHGERILINDCKPSGMNTALAVNIARDTGLLNLELTIDPRI